jgi:streptogramin lyase
MSGTVRPARSWLIGALLVVGAASLVSFAHAENRVHPASTAKCKHVIRKVHRRKRRVRVCPKTKPGLPVVGTVAAEISTDAAPLGLLALPNGVWVAAHHGTSIARIDPSSNAVVARVPAANGDQPARMVSGDGWLFAVNYSGETVTVIDPVTNAVRSSFQAPYENCCFPAFGAGSLWLLGFSSSDVSRPDRLTRVDPSGRVVMSMPLPSPDGLVFGAGSVWGSSDGKIFRLGPATNQITARISTAAVPMAFAAGSVWAADWTADGAHVVRIDPTNDTIAATIRLPGPASALNGTDSAIWVAEGPPDSPGSHLWKIDPATNRVSGQVKLGRSSALDDVAVSDDGSVWASLFDADLVLRIGPG